MFAAQTTRMTPIDWLRKETPLPNGRMSNRVAVSILRLALGGPE